MIIFFSGGRVGNQIFQYAFLKSIANENEKIVSTHMKDLETLFDVPDNNFIFLFMNERVVARLKMTLKPYFFNVLAKLKLIGYVKQDRNKQILLPSYSRYKGLFPITFVETDYFQSEDFVDPEKFDLRIKLVHVEKAKKILSMVDSSFSKVFVHIRRGDYVHLKDNGKIGIDLPKSYYEAAIEIIESEVENPFYIFLSDDPGFVKCCFKDIENKYVSEDEMAIDFAIMTMCTYGIVSNSSFSWWGAYLMAHRKKVVFPKYWYGWKRKIESHVGIQPGWATVIECEV